MIEFDDVFRMAARGVVDLWKCAETSGRPIQEVENEPASFRIARARLSRYAMERHAATPSGDRIAFTDLTASLHETVRMLMSPPRDWPEPYRNDMDINSGFSLVDPTFLRPERIAYEQSSVHQRLNDIQENAHFARLSGLISGLPRERGDSLYTLVRRFLVEGGLRSKKELFRFGMENGTVKDFIDNAYEAVPQHLVGRSGKALKCVRCGSMVATVEQSGQERRHCLNSACRTEKSVEFAEAPDALSDYKTLKGELVLYWLVPGYDEVRLFDALKKKRTDWVLYPNRDEVDIGLPDKTVGIDIKSYARPQYLGARLAAIHASEPLLQYDRKIIGVPDRLAAAHRGYLRTAREELRSRSPGGRPSWTPEFMTVSSIKKEFAR